MRNRIVAALALPALAGFAEPATAQAFWGIQVAGSFSEATARNAYEALQAKYPDLLGARAPEVLRGVMIGGGPGAFYAVVLPAASRAEADEFCVRLRQAGGACVVGKRR